MNWFSKALGTAACITLLTGCVTYNGDYDDGGAYYSTPGYSTPQYSANVYTDNSCDYYNPPWGYPADYCRYDTWNDPVYFGGTWYSGPIYHRTYSGANWFWLNGDWRRDEWRGARPRIDWDRGGNRYWRGDIIRRARDDGDRRDFDGRRDFGGRNNDNDRRDANDRNFGNGGRNDNAQRDGGDGRRDFGGRGPGNNNFGNNNAGNPPPPAQTSDPRLRFRGQPDAGPANVAAPDASRGPNRGPGNPGNPNAANNPVPVNQRNVAPAPASAPAAVTNAAPAPNVASPPRGRSFLGGFGSRPPNAEATPAPTPTAAPAAAPTPSDQDGGGQRNGRRGRQQAE